MELKTINVRSLIRKRILKMIMRTFIFLLCTTVFSFNTNNSTAQERVKIDSDKTVTIDEVFEIIMNQTKYRFLYPENLFNEEPKVRLKKGDISIGHLLKSSIPTDDFIVILGENNTIVINKKDLEQQVQITGQVKDESGLSIAGVTVLIKGTIRGTATDFDGSYNLVVPSESSVLVFSALGFETKEIKVGSQKRIDVTLKESIKELDEIIVSTGYQRIPKERATGAFETVSSKELQETPTIDINERLEGQIPGVNVDVKTGTIAIRGTNNYGATPPLVVVDGFPMPENDFRFSKGRSYQGASILSYINPDDIENITVLKDASATAIWGSRAANGVIVIETKSGKKSAEPVISFSSSTTIGNKISLDKLRQMSTSEYVDFEKEMVNSGFLVDNSSNWQAINPSEVQNVMFAAQRGEITEAEQNTMLSEIANRNNLGQINKYLLRNSLSQQYDLSVSGGSDRNTYFISSGYNKDEPVMRGNNSNSYFVTVNNTTKLKPFLSLETGLNYVKSHYRENRTANEALSNVSTTALRPYTMIVDENGQSIDRYLKFRPEVIQDFESQGYLPWTYNYLDELNYSNTVTEGENIRLNAKLTATITDWLNVEGSGMYTSIKNDLTSLNELDSYNARNLINEATSVSNGSLVYGIPLGGRHYSSSSTNTTQSIRFQMNINKSFNDLHDINFLAGAEVREERREGTTQTRYGFNSDTNSSVSVNPTEYYTTVYGWQTFIGSFDGSINKYRSRYLSQYALGSYTYNDKYFVSGSVRLDDFNLLGAATRKDRVLPLWSTGFRWDIYKEGFLDNVNWLNALSARITYGKAGSSPTGGLGNNSAIISVGNLDYNTQLPVTSISLPENGELKWETTKSWNYGLDFGLFNSRLNGSFNLYYKKSEDILTSVPFNPTYGFSYLTYNTGTLKGRGVELGVTGDIFRGDFSWRSTFNFSYNKNEVTDSRFEATTVNQHFSGLPKTGKSLSSIYAYQWAGLDANGQSQIYNSNGEIIDSNTGITEVLPEDLKYMRTTQAPYFGGFLNNLSYKNFNLNFRITYYAGHVFRNTVLQNYPSYQGVYYGTSLSKEAIVADRWRVAGDEATTNIPGLSNINYNSLSRYQNADINVLPADNIRLQQISLGYSFPSNWLDHTFFKSMNLSFTARNLGLLWKKNDAGIDPLYLSTNNYNTLPPERNYTLQFNLGF